MTAHNIVIEEFIQALTSLKDRGYKMINLDMLQDEGNSGMNKLIVHPVKTKTSYSSSPKKESEKEIKNPNISRENNDIFNIQYFFGL
jgi:hypothetical protein